MRNKQDIAPLASAEQRHDECHEYKRQSTELPSLKEQHEVGPCSEWLEPMIVGAQACEVAAQALWLMSGGSDSSRVGATTPERACQGFPETPAKKLGAS